MNDEPDDPSLIALGAAISDGAPVDWLEVESHASDGERQDLVRAMRDVAALITAHQQVGAADPPDAPPTTARHWQHLVIFEPIGEGAFGTVYRGWDPRLEREVAVKLLPRPAPPAPSPLAEARHLARVRHTNVVVIHGADQDDEQVGIWMEYIDGQTLASMVRATGPMSAREVTGIGVDLCRALSALHAAGLLHRDVKAHNVMREVGGRIVLMDFSGAQALTPQDGEVFSGTPLYMAPELFEGAAATTATDVYSLGILLFFLLTGAVPVDGPTIAALRAAHGERHRKRLRDLRSDVPETIVRVIEGATAHDPADRYQTVGELEHALTGAAGRAALPTGVESGRGPAGSGAAAAKPATRRLFSPAAVLATAAALLIGLLAAPPLTRWLDPPPEPLIARFSIGPPFISRSWPRLSPDGRQVVFGTRVQGRDRFWIEPIETRQGHALMNTTAHETPFWSPDSRALGFFADGKLMRISVDGGDPQFVAEALQPHGGDWQGHRILFAARDGVYSVAPDGSGLTQITRLDREAGEFQHAWPRFLPDGKRFLYLIRSSRRGRPGIYVGSLDGGAPVWLMPPYSRFTYSGGYLFYVRDGSLLARPFDPRVPALSGTAVPLAGRLKYHAEGDAAFDVAESGTLIYYLEPGQPSTRLSLVDRRGGEVQALTEPGAYRQPRFSPDGTRVVAESANPSDGNVDLWVYEVARQAKVMLTGGNMPEVSPVWSPEGRRVVYSSKRDSTYHLFTKTVDDTRPEEPLEPAINDALAEDWSADGRYLSVTIPRTGLAIIPLLPGQKQFLVRRDTRQNIWHSQFSPDGRWLAYMSEESEGPEVFVEPFPATGDRRQISTRGGAEPHWSRDSHELFYLAADSNLMVLNVASPDWQNAKPATLFRVSVPDVAGHTDYDVAPDGQTFVVNVFLADPVLPPIDVVINWQRLLKN